MKALRLALLLALTFLSRAQEARFYRVAGPVAANITAFSADGNITWTNAVTNATFTVQTAPSLVSPSNWVDYVQVPVTNPVTTLRLYDPSPPTNMVLIPAGSFTMGSDERPGYGEQPTHTVYVSAFYMDRYEVTKALWNEVHQWATNHGYSFDYSDSGLGKAANHPAHSMTWDDAVKWCNARSEREGRVPAYHTNAAQTTVYRTGHVDVQNDWVNWNSGYRLPTEAEWEKAARGGMSGRRFPWSDTDNITHSRANYYSFIGVVYDISPTRDFHPTFNDGIYPYTSPAGYFAPNEYGLFDMAGNIWEWCWDMWASYSSGTQTDPRGPPTGAGRAYRGGNWSNLAFDCRSASRNYSQNPAYRDYAIGFRAVLPPGSEGDAVLPTKGRQRALRFSASAR